MFIRRVHVGDVFVSGALGAGGAKVIDVTQLSPASFGAGGDTSRKRHKSEPISFNLSLFIRLKSQSSKSKYLPPPVPIFASKPNSDNNSSSISQATLVFPPR